MEDDTQHFGNYIYAVAVGTQPLLWTIHCELCDEELHEGTADEKLLNKLELSHKKYHNLNK